MLEDTDERIARVMPGLLRARRALQVDPHAFDDLIGSIMVELDLGMQGADEAAHRHGAAGNVLAFPAARSCRYRHQDGRHACVRPNSGSRKRSSVIFR